MKILIAIAIAANVLVATPLQAAPLGAGLERGLPGAVTLAASRRQNCEAKCRAKYGDYEPCARGETRMCSVELGRCMRACR